MSFWCEDCDFYNTDRTDQPCCGCVDGENFKRANKDERTSRYVNVKSLVERLDVSPLLNNIRDGGILKAGVLDLIERQPTADVVEVRHGKWVDSGERFGHGAISPFAIFCSVCGSSAGTSWMKYCPNCGAKMDGKGDGE